MVISKDSSDPFTTLFIVVIIKLIKLMVGVIVYFEIKEDFTKHFNMFRLDQENLDPVNHYRNRYLLLDSG
jgi:hypothetical protein